MQCEACRAECDQCQPFLSIGEREAAAKIVDDPDAWLEEHRRTAHPMRIQGAMWVCEQGHRREASGRDIMKASGATPLFEEVK